MLMMTMMLMLMLMLMMMMMMLVVVVMIMMQAIVKLVCLQLQVCELTYAWMCLQANVPALSFLLIHSDRKTKQTFSTLRFYLPPRNNTPLARPVEHLTVPHLAS